MDAKLKTLKVVDLKDILARAHVALPQKANKQDLIARIVASSQAKDVYYSLHPSHKIPTPTDDLLAPPEDVDWNVDEVAASEQAPAAKPAAPAPTPAPQAPPEEPPASVSPPPSEPPSAPAVEDPELEKRKQRAERFGIPLVVPKTQPAKDVSRPRHAPATVAPEVLHARAERFGLATRPVKEANRKRPSPAEHVDAEEEERRKKRAERFGT